MENDKGRMQVKHALVEQTEIKYGGSRLGDGDGPTPGIPK
jgi:hypothetical protein